MGIIVNNLSTAGASAANDIGNATGGTTGEKINSLLPSASTSSAGKVQLASTGEQNSSKVPRATGSEIASILTAGGYSYASLTHASRHQNGGADEIATGTPGANAIPKADSSGKLDSWISDASTSVKGKVQLATAAELEAGTESAKVLTPAVVRGATIKRTKMPDGATGLYQQDNWATNDSWSGSGVTFSSLNGVATFTYTLTGQQNFGRTITGSCGKIIGICFKTNSSKQYILTSAAGYQIIGELQSAGSTTPNFVTKFFIIPEWSGNGTKDVIRIYTYDGTGVENISIDWIWVGDYSYLVGSISDDTTRIINQLNNVYGASSYATGTITSNGTNLSNGDTVTIYGKTYTAKTALTPAEGEFLIGATAADSMTNLANAINGDSGTYGTKHYCAAAHLLVSASANSLIVTLTSKVDGELGNQIMLSKSAATLTLSGSTLSGGYSAAAKKIATLAAPIIAGNGTRPAAALIDISDTNKIGYEQAVDVASGGTVTLPSSGTWLWFVYGYGATISGAKRGSSAGGTVLTVSGANATVWYRRYA